jgi:hypothetical protein
VSKLLSGVFSTITFPLHQDSEAISKAVNELLREGWSFLLTDTGINMSRGWTIEECGLAQVESPKSPSIKEEA